MSQNDVDLGHFVPHPKRSRLGRLYKFKIFQKKSFCLAFYKTVPSFPFLSKRLLPWSALGPTIFCRDHWSSAVAATTYSGWWLKNSFLDPFQLSYIDSGLKSLKTLSKSLKKWENPIKAFSTLLFLIFFLCRSPHANMGCSKGLHPKKKITLHRGWWPRHLMVATALEGNPNLSFSFYFYFLYLFSK